jgi:hypothetical protein
MQAALDPRGGKAPLLACRVLNDDLTRVTELAEQRGENRSQLTRELLRLGLDALEHEQGPPDGG